MPSGKTSKGLGGQRRTASAAPAEPCPELFPSRICRPTASWPGPVAAGSSLPRDKTACTCLSCSRAHRTAAPQLPLGAPLSPRPQASLDPSPDRPGFSDFIPPGGHESGQLGSPDPKRPPPAERPPHDRTPPLPRWDLDLQGALGAASQLESELCPAPYSSISSPPQA